ncbi:radical SAM family heme chaperone HemW [Corallincola platygyrae]|uniref:Heme chaperone HemW n=1 Tax=Corallincola platygyrae TaxID=1193278 RepID=A0ABW4XNI0_9GAMM
MLTLPPLSLYIHIPWCVQKCPYCDFNSHALKEGVPEDQYVDALLTDLKQDAHYAQGRQISSIFIGGGTPSLLSADAISRLLSGVRDLVPLQPDCEITLEANPGTVESDKFTGFQQAGVNRISIGVQSFQNEKLTALGRIHGKNEALRAIEQAQQAGLDSFNIDLMHGLPDQSLEDALSDLAQGIAMAPPHMSWYQLTIEPNTLFHSRPPTLPDDDILWDIYEQGHKVLQAAGYRQYEVSAYHRIDEHRANETNDYRCRHNLNYWRFGDYLGIGCGAHGKITLPLQNQILRTSKIKHPRGYLAAKQQFVDQQSFIANEDLPFEYFMNRFRLFEAFPISEYSERTGQPLSSVEKTLADAEQQGLLTIERQHLQLSLKGHRYLNSLLESFLAD